MIIVYCYWNVHFFIILLSLNWCRRTEDLDSLHILSIIANWFLSFLQAQIAPGSGSLYFLFMIQFSSQFKCPWMLIVMLFWLQYNAQFKVFEPLEYSYDVCDTILLWEQVNVQSFFLLYLPPEEIICTDVSLWMQYRNMTTVLTREYLDARPDGWLDYAAKRIAQLYDFLEKYSMVYLLWFLDLVLQNLVQYMLFWIR